MFILSTHLKFLFFIYLTFLSSLNLFGGPKPKSSFKNDSLSLSQKKFVTSRWDGQLGNQMFCVATTLAYAWDNNLKPIFPFLNEHDANKSYNRDRIFFRLDTSNYPRAFKHVIRNYSMSYIPIPPSLGDLFLDGPFFAWKYFHHHREELIQVFRPSDQILDNLYAKYGDLIANPNTVAIHVRTTSKHIHEHISPFPGLKYYELAMKEFPPDSLFVVFSDRIKWCKKNFAEKFPDKTFVFIEGNDHIEDLFLMSLMKHNILSNFTYSFWGAYLNENPNKKVKAPLRQYRPPLVWPIQDFYLPEWDVIPYDPINDSYPEDMYWYDEKSTSLNEANG